MYYNVSSKTKAKRGEHCMSKKHLSCKICDFKSDDLVDHIEKKHAGHPEGSKFADGILAWYMLKFDVDETQVVWSGSDAVSEDSIKIGDVEMPLANGSVFVPAINEAFFFSDFASDICTDILENRRIMLTGHTGCGKTSIIQQIAARTKNNLIRVNLNGQMTISDFVGMWSVRGGEMVWVDGVLPKAMREGYWMILDEIDFAGQEILSVLNSVLEPSGALMLKERDHEVVHAHPEFRVFATANTVGCMSQFRSLYQGTNLMNEAFLDRWSVYHVNYLPADEEAKVLVASVPKLTVKIATVIVKVAGMIRESFNKEEIQCTFSLRRMLDWAKLMVRYRDPMKAAQTSILNKISPEDAEVIKGIIQRVMIGNAGGK